MKCEGILGLLLGHNHKEVFDTSSIACNNPDSIKAALSNEMLSLAFGTTIEKVLYHLRTDQEVYIQHVCKRCGNIVKRQ
jgi:hypothetical protein